MYKETTLHSFEVHQKLATLFPLFASMCTAIHRSMTRNCARVFVAVVWSRCWRDFSALFRLLKSRSTRNGAIWEVQIEAKIASQANFTTASSCVFVTDEDAPLPQHLSRGSATEGRVDE